MEQFKTPLDKREILAHVGDMSQIAGVRRSFICDGRARDVEALDINTGGGLELCVLPGRGMDIAHAKYRGVPVSFIAKAGLSSADAYEPHGFGWLRGFFGGLLTTCGLSNVGWACEDEDAQLGEVHHGLHGRLSSTGAEAVSYGAAWDKDGGYVIRASGRMREGLLHGENLSLTRTITTGLGARSVCIHDEVENDGFVSKPLMILYHINAGYPLLDENSEMILPTIGISGSAESEGSPESYNDFSEPVHEGEQYVYKHALGDLCGKTKAAIINKKLGYGLYVEFDKTQLPNFMQWKRLSKGDYVVGLEPANCESVGRAEMRKRGGLRYIEPGEQKSFDLVIGILDGEDEISAFRKDCGKLCGL
jgi:hypothetical protein